MTEKKMVLGQTRDNFTVATAALAPSKFKDLSVCLVVNCFSGYCLSFLFILVFCNWLFRWHYNCVRTMLFLCDYSAELIHAITFQQQLDTFMWPHGNLR